MPLGFLTNKQGSINELRKSLEIYDATLNLVKRGVLNGKDVTIKEELDCREEDIKSMLKFTSPFWYDIPKNTRTLAKELGFRM